ncbi:MAG: hypothetical protein RMX68_003585 [Aulosira sp. ZfuVER01]|nr:hypothetical protein [Aulosira sp. ZfuVER01]MDZ7999879.1 hypothetical protein [Aulosira sp. DedVER01a]MDZ8051316.1 hypothetical protein [Aulosira sp. ZfuCHP01]
MLFETNYYSSILLSIHSQSRPQLDGFAVLLTKFGSFWTALPILSAIAIIIMAKTVVAIANLFTHHCINYRLVLEVSKKGNVI